MSRKTIIFLVVISTIAIISIGTAIYLYYLWMPAMIQLEVIPFGQQHIPTFRPNGGFNESDLVQFPSIKMAMQLVDNNYKSQDRYTIPGTVHPPVNEARQIAERLEMSPDGGEGIIYYYNASLQNQPEKAYFIMISIGYHICWPWTCLPP